MNDKTSSASAFEASLAELEQIVQRLESGELGLEESLQVYEKGIGLSKQCKDALSAAELKINELSQELDDNRASSEAGE